MKVRAVLFDVRSIQRYIYTGNKLQTNIGASYLVEHVFDKLLVEAMEKMPELIGGVVLHTEKACELFPAGKVCRIGYIGGGNALLLFTAEAAEGLEKKVVAAFTRRLLEACPGLHVGAAVGELDLDNYQESRGELVRQLKESQNRLFPAVNVPYTGFTHLCDIDGEVANYWEKDGILTKDTNQHYFSKEAASKAAMAKVANEVLREEFKELPEEYNFPLALDELGMTEGESYLAIVHIDGNNMGEKFRGCKTMDSYRSMSEAVKGKTKEAFGKLLQTIVAEYAAYVSRKDENGKKKEAMLNLKKGILPIRPLILGGDDVTFVCPAKLALAYSKRFIEFMEQEDEGIVEPEARSIDCCGGIAILPTSYPFFRGYQLAEQVCDRAKKAMRSRRDAQGASSWLDFVFLHGEQAPTLEQILAQEYHGVQGSLHFGPYRVNGGVQKGAERRYLIENLITCAKAFAKSKAKNGDGMAHNKVKELRRVLQLDKSAVQSFLQQQGHLEQELPQIEGWEVFNDTLFHGQQRVTPFVDAIEIADFLEGV